MATPSSPALKHHPCRYPAAHNLPAAKVSAVKMKGERAYRSSRVPAECPRDATPLPRLHRHTSRSSHVTPPRRWCAAEPPPPAASTHPQTRPAVERQIPQPAKPALFPAQEVPSAPLGLTMPSPSNSCQTSRRGGRCRRGTSTGRAQGRVAMADQPWAAARGRSGCLASDWDRLVLDLTSSTARGLLMAWRWRVRPKVVSLVWLADGRSRMSWSLPAEGLGRRRKKEAAAACPRIQLDLPLSGRLLTGPCRSRSVGTDPSSKWNDFFIFIGLRPSWPPEGISTHIRSLSSSSRSYTSIIQPAASRSSRQPPKPRLAPPHLSFHPHLSFPPPE